MIRTREFSPRKARTGCDVDDPPEATLLHTWDDGSAHPEDAHHVHIERVLDRSGIQVLNCADRPFRPSRIDKHIDGAKVPGHISHQTVRRFVIRHIGREGDRPAADRMRDTFS
jgi:hypothetical protein